MTVPHAEIVQTCINGDVMMDIASIKENIVMEYQIARMAVTRNQFLCECGGESLSRWL
jgi:hypothetical protein